MYTHNNVKLRPMIEADLPIVRMWRNRPHIRRNMYTDHIITAEEHAAWYAKVSADHAAIPMLFEHDGVPLGFVNFSDFSEQDRRCRWGFYIGATDAPRGAGTALGILAMDFIFESHGMRKVTGEAFAFNEASLRLHRRLGFSDEARLVGHVFKDGRFEDIIVLAHFAERWERMKGMLAQKYMPAEEVLV